MKVLTANRLSDGEAVWWGENEQWIETLAGSAIAGSKEDEARLEAAGAAGIHDNLVVDVNLIDVELAHGAIRPVRLRERIRAAGPTNRLDLGKQASGEAPASSAA